MHRLHISAHQGPDSKSIPGFMVPAVLAGLLGVGLLDVASADANEVCLHKDCYLSLICFLFINYLYFQFMLVL